MDLFLWNDEVCIQRSFVVIVNERRARVQGVLAVVFGRFLGVSIPSLAFSFLVFGSWALLVRALLVLGIASQGVASQGVAGPGRC